MRAILLAGLAALSTPALAEPFSDSMLPHSTNFSFNWSSVGVSGTTSFEFSSTTPVTSGQCGNIFNSLGEEWCHNGTFTTGNLGNGTFTTRVQRHSCVNSSTTPIFGFYFNVDTCQNRQRLVATYQYVSPAPTPAVYNGVAALGTATRARFCFFTACGSFGSWTYTPTPQGDFPGNLSGPATGTFTEL